MDIIAHNLDINDGKYTSNSKLNKLIDECIQKKIYERSKLKVLISSLLIFLTLVAMSFIYAYIRTYKNTLDSSNIVSFSVITLIGLLIIPFSSFSGSKKISSVIGVVCSFFAASVSYWLIEVILKGSHLLGGLGEPYVYFAYYILVGLMFGYLGGLQIERYRLIYPQI